MGKHNSLRRNIVLFVCVIIILAGVIVYVSMMRPTPWLIPPESPEILAKRLAPENAYFTLLEASKLLPKDKPSDIVQPSADGAQRPEPYHPLPNSLGAFLGIGRPDTDPELLAYVKACAPAVAKAREAVAAPYYLLPTRWSELERYFDPGYHDDSVYTRMRTWTLLCDADIAVSLLSIREGQDPSDGLAGMLDALRLGSMVSGDGSSHPYRYGCGMQNSVLQLLVGLAPALPSESLPTLREELQTLHATQRPPAACFDWCLRAFDNAKFPELPDSHTLDGHWGWIAFSNRKFPELPNSRASDNIELKWKKLCTIRLRRQLLGNMDDLHAALALSPHAYRDWRIQRRDLCQLSEATTFFDVLAIHEQLVFGNGWLDACYRGADIALALEQFHHDTGQYPNALADLSPKYLDSTPTDPFTDGPFAYKLIDTDYLLYSAGENAKDNNAKRDDIIIHRPPITDAPN